MPFFGHFPKTDIGRQHGALKMSRCLENILVGKFVGVFFVSGEDWDAAQPQLSGDCPRHMDIHIKAIHGLRLRIAT